MRVHCVTPHAHPLTAKQPCCCSKISGKPLIGIIVATAAAVSEPERGKRATCRPHLGHHQDNVHHQVTAQTRCLQSVTGICRPLVYIRVRHYAALFRMLKTSTDCSIYVLNSVTADPPPPSPRKQSSDLDESHKSSWPWLGGSGPLDPPGQRRAWPLSLTVSCFSKIDWFYLSGTGSPG